MILNWILTLSILAGQLVKLPLSEGGGLTLLDATVIFFCLLGLFKTKLRLIKPPLFVTSALIFIFIALLSLIFTPLHLTALDYLTSLFYTVRFSLYVLFGWLILSGAFPHPKKNLNQVLLFSGVGLASLGLLQFIFISNLTFLSSYGWDPHYFRTVTTFLDPNFAGAFFVLTLILITSLRGTKVTKQSLLFFVVIYLALLTTFSRSSYLMFLISGLTLSFLKRSKSLVLLVIILFTILLIGFQLYAQFIAKPRNINREESAQYRLTTWQQGLTIFQHSPIIGVGFNAYRFAIKEYHLGDEKFILSHGSSSNDSSLLSVLATTGILGFVAYALFLASLLGYGLKFNFTVTAGLAGLLIHSFFANSLFYPPILLWLILISQIPKK